MKRGLYILVGVFGTLMSMVCLVVYWCLGCLLQLGRANPSTPLADSAQLLLSPDALLGACGIFLFLLAGVALVSIGRRQGGATAPLRLFPLFRIAVVLFLLSLLGGYFLT